MCAASHAQQGQSHRRRCVEHEVACVASCGAHCRASSHLSEELAEWIRLAVRCQRDVRSCAKPDKTKKAPEVCLPEPLVARARNSTFPPPKLPRIPGYGSRSRESSRWGGSERHPNRRRLNALPGACLSSVSSIFGRDRRFGADGDHEHVDRVEPVQKPNILA